MHEFYDPATGLVVNEEELPVEVVCTIRPTDDLDLDAVVRTKLHGVLALYDDGWRVGGRLDIAPELENLELMIEIKRLADGGV